MLLIDGAKTCTCCNEWMMPWDFYKDNQRKDGLTSECKSCKNIRRSENRRKENTNQKRNRIEKDNIRQRRRKYGISENDYNKMFEEQKGCCAICGKHQVELTKSLAVDHNHISNQNRGLLCDSCNLGLGKFYVDGKEIELLEKAIKYVKKYK